jgi:hypothetical protein
MTQRIPENFSAAEWRLVTIMGNTMPPRDPNDDDDDDDDDEDEDNDTEPDDERQPPVVSRLIPFFSTGCRQSRWNNVNCCNVWKSRSSPFVPTPLARTKVAPQP